MSKLVVRIIGGTLTSYLGIGLIVAAAAAVGLSEQLWEGYVPLSWASAIAGVVISGLLLLYAHFVGGVPFRAFSFAWSSFDAVVLAFVMFVTLLLSGSYMLILDGLGVRSLAMRPLQWSVILIGLLRAAGTFHEEVLSRGYVLPLLRRRYSVGASLAISAGIFMLMHLPTRGVSYLIPTWLLGGVLYGYVYLKSGSLWVAGGTHAVHNWAADLFLYSELAPSVFAFTPALGAVEKMMFEVVLSLVMFGLIYLVYGRGTQLLEPSHRLQDRWSVAQAEREIRVKPVPA